jgi:hypothetical protein
MFNKKTVFVLGAGASWHYGYPTGEGLVDSVITMAERLSSYCEFRLSSGQVVQMVPDYVSQFIDASKGTSGAKGGWIAVKNECAELIARLKTVKPLLIDHFLYWNETLRPIGTLMIAAVILECEANWLSNEWNQNRKKILRDGPIKQADDLDFTKYKDDWYRFVVHRLIYGCVQ